jgi:hypothetical protein
MRTFSIRILDHLGVFLSENWRKLTMRFFVEEEIKRLRQPSAEGTKKRVGVLGAVALSAKVLAVGCHSQARIAA